MDDIFNEEEHESRFADTAFLKKLSRLPDQVKYLRMLLRVRWWGVCMLYSYWLPLSFPSPCTLACETWAPY